MSDDKVYILINGILTNPSNINGWTDIMCTKLNQIDNIKCEKFEYFSDPFFRRLTQRKNTEALIKLIKQYDGHSITLVGHSNGCDLISRVLLSGLSVDKIIMIQGAVESDCWINGVNQSILDGNLKSITFYCSKNDLVLKYIAPISKILGGWIGLGYGSLGYTGPVNLIKSNTVKIKWHKGGHGTLLHGRYLDNLIKDII